MKNPTMFAVAASFCVMVVVLVAVVAHVRLQQSTLTGHTEPPPQLVVEGTGAIGAIGTLIDIGANTLTIEAQMQGSTTPWRFTVTVDEKTTVTRVGSAPDYATSTATFADFKKGMVVNVATDDGISEIRHATRIVIPPPPAASQ